MGGSPRSRPRNGKRTRRTRWWKQDQCRVVENSTRNFLLAWLSADACLGTAAADACDHLNSVGIILQMSTNCDRHSPRHLLGGQARGLLRIKGYCI